ncbi:hypothetical protein [Demequina sediminis]|nr:hypothetical protein [Demequina sediminis]
MDAELAALKKPLDASVLEREEAEFATFAFEPLKKGDSKFLLDDEEDDGSGYVELQREAKRQADQKQREADEEAKALKKAERQRKREDRENRTLSSLWTIAAVCVAVTALVVFAFVTRDADTAGVAAEEAFQQGVTAGVEAVGNATPSGAVSDVRVRPSEVAEEAPKGADDADTDVAEGIVLFGD